MLALWNPFVPVKKPGTKTIFDSLFEDTFNVFQTMGINQEKNEDNSYSISIDVPGVKENDINVHLSDDGIITIKGERKTTNSSYSVNKSFTLPEDCDPESLKAELKDGVLTLNLSAKSLPTVKEPKKIPISVK